MRQWLVKGAMGASAAGALAWLYASRVERAWVELDRFTVALEAPGLPPRGLTILHLSDFHFRASGDAQSRKIARLRKLLEKEHFDVLALTGDLVHDVAGFPIALATISELHPRLGAFSVPGNHDYAEYSVWGVFGQTWQGSGPGGRVGPADVAVVFRKLADFARKVVRNELVRLPVGFNDVPAMHATLQAHGVQPLVNRAIPLAGDGASVWFAGVDDLTEGRPDLGAALAGVPPDAPVVLLAHNPDVWLDPRVERAILVLSGHTHGGQVRLPLVGAAHTQGTHLGRRRPSGWFQRGRAHMFVSRGVGESIPLRFGVRPQAALIRLVPARQA